jgi:methylenetetrahydrofolate reductase (NADPH)
MKIISKLQEARKPVYSFEFFPPKTPDGRENLYLRMERMCALEPLFIDITWGAKGSTKNETIQICEYAQKFFAVDALCHLTCTGLTRDELKQSLKEMREAGICNILALQGDPPRGAPTWTSTPNGCDYAIDLVELIREEHGDYFCIAVAGFPEMHPKSAGDRDQDIAHLKAKIDAGADFVLTQFFYDVSVFNNFIQECRSGGITCPIIPGMMPIQSYQTFVRMTQLCSIHVPQTVWTDLEPIKANEAKVKEYGISLCSDMCRELLAHDGDIPGWHFYTLNLERSVRSVLSKLGIAGAASRALPWRASRQNLESKEEVRPINWANRQHSYISRTQTWDDFPNGRWGDARSPAFGDLSETHLIRSAASSKEARLAMWGEAPVTSSDIKDVFCNYVQGRIPVLPWCEEHLAAETNTITDVLTRVNNCGILTINSQPPVNGLRSDHPVFGWGPINGRVYQKAYVEFFCAPETLDLIFRVMSSGLQADKPYNNLFITAIDSEGRTRQGDDGRDRADSCGSGSAGGSSGTTALTWGAFPNMEIKQPTVFNIDVFEVWSKEAFKLWTDSWAILYDDESESSELIYCIHDTYYLVAIVDNDFVDSCLMNFLEDIVETHESQGPDVDEAVEF